MTLEEAEDMLWGTYGKDAVENHYLFGRPLPPMRIKRLGDCGDEHLRAILFGQDQISDEHRAAITMILRERHRKELAHLERTEKLDASNRRADTRAKVSEPLADTEHSE